MKNSMMIVFLKELKDLFRDKKTLIVSIVVPLLIFPIMFGLMGRGIEGSTKKIEQNLKIAVSGDTSSSFCSFLKSQKSIKIIESSDMKKDIQNGKIYAGIVLPDGIDKNIQAGNQPEITLVYDDASQNSSTAEEVLQNMIQAYSKEVVKARLSAKGIDEKILEPVNVKEDIVAKQKTSTAQMLISMILPLFLIMYATSSPMAAAIDLGAGEKERGTLEPLLTTQASRMSLLFGKFFAITVMGVIGVVASILGLVISFKTSPGIFKGASGISLSLNSLWVVALFTIILVMVFAALELAVSIYARSFKEAQTYVSPLTIIGMLGGFSTYMMDIKNITPVYLNIPLVNVSVILKEVISGIYNPYHILIVFVWSAVYITISILFARYMFSREDVIFRT